MASKIEKELPKKQSFYSLDNNVINKEYIDCIKLSKKENITKDNIHEIMLSQIPNVSTSLARIILQKHNNIFQLKESLELDKDCLNSIKYVLSNGKERKISSLAINSIKNLLV